MDRIELIAMIEKMMLGCNTGEDIADAVLNALTPEDGEECPVCGISP